MSGKKSKKEFASKIGLVAATVGSAVGLGNVWRFPAEVQSNGGAAFLLIYIGCVLLLGIPVMLGEFSIGRAGRSDAVGAFARIGAKRRWQSIGWLALLASYMILCFYMVVAGWTFEYLWQSVSGGLYESVSQAPDQNSAFTAKMNEFISTTWDPLINTSVMIVINIVVLMGGIQKGIERMSNIAMPILFVILAVFVGVSLSLPGAMDGVAYFLKPDFSAVTPGTVIDALGQAFFSLSLGMGILITYAAYYPKNTKLTSTAVTVSLLDLLVAVMMGLIIFPAVTSFNLSGDGLVGTTLLFVTLPEVFMHMGHAQVWSSLFFLLLTIAALTSTISIAEVAVSFIRDRFKVRRSYACLIVLLPLFLFSSICSLSMGPLNQYTIVGMNIFDLLDNVATNILLPVGSIFLCVYVGWFAPRGFMLNQLSNGGKLKSSFYKIALFLVRYVAPILIALVLISYFIK